MPKLAIILTEEYADWEFAPIATISREFYQYEVHIASPNASVVKGISGISSQPDYRMEDIKPSEYDALILIGGKIWEGDNPPNLTPLLKQFLAANKLVAGICGATLALARADLLDDRVHTSNETNYIGKYIASYSGHAKYIQTNGAICDRNVISAGGFSPHQFAAEIFKFLGMLDADVTDYLKSLGAEFT
ncbi:MAG: DJ-1/PfpI family protein [Hyphomicrobiales bacterium]